MKVSQPLVRLKTTSLEQRNCSSHTSAHNSQKVIYSMRLGINISLVSLNIIAQCTSQRRALFIVDQYHIFNWRSLKDREN